MDIKTYNINTDIETDFTLLVTLLKLNMVIAN